MAAINHMKFKKTEEWIEIGKNWLHEMEQITNLYGLSEKGHFLKNKATVRYKKELKEWRQE